MRRRWREELDCRQDEGLVLRCSCVVGIAHVFEDSVLDFAGVVVVPFQDYVHVVVDCEALVWKMFQEKEE